MYKEIQGDLFAAIPALEVPNHRILLPHIVNDKGGWGSGFVLPLAKAYPQAEKDYRDWAAGVAEEATTFKMGNTYSTKGTDNTFIIHMCAQTLSGRRPHERDLRYNELANCMDQVIVAVETLLNRGRTVEIVAPKFGSGLAGGKWEFIHELIEDCWIRRGLDVTVYYL